jgi:GrpB-like predicted nucleotidyltransferase (UPF0157 family)
MEIRALERLQKCRIDFLFSLHKPHTILHYDQGWWEKAKQEREHIEMLTLTDILSYQHYGSCLVSA